MGPLGKKRSQACASMPLTFHCDLVLPSSRMCKQVHMNRDFSHRIIHTGAWQAEGQMVPYWRTGRLYTQLLQVKPRAWRLLFYTLKQEAVNHRSYGDVSHGERKRKEMKNEAVY